MLIPGLAIGHKIAAGLAVSVLAGGAALGAAGSQDLLPGQSKADEHRQNQTQEVESLESHEGEPRDIKGIPQENPNFVDDTDGVCEKFEAAVKTTPSGNQVRVPCHAAEPGPPPWAGPPDTESLPDVVPDLEEKNLPAPAQTARAGRGGPPGEGE